MNRLKDQKKQKDEVTQINYMTLLEHYQEEDLEKDKPIKDDKGELLVITGTTTKKRGRIFLRNLEQRER
jgi:hypothetical protein